MNPRNIGPRGVWLRRTGGWVALVGAGALFARGRPLAGGLASGAGVLMLLEARRGVCVGHAALGRRSREGRHLYGGDPSPDEQATLRRSAMGMLAESALAGAMAQRAARRSSAAARARAARASTSLPSAS